MCRMLGLVGPPPLPIREALDAFYPLCAKGCVKKGSPPEHRDGFGVSGFSGGRAVYFERRAEPAGDHKEAFGRAAARAVTSQTPVVVAHFRKASGGPAAIANTHPFHFRDWIFAQNGTIFNASELPLLEAKPQGETDSERFALWLLEQILIEPNPTDALAKLLKAKRDSLVFSSLTFLLTDGQTLWAYRDVGEKNLENGETVADREKYYTLYRAQVGEGAAVSSEPLPALAPSWDPIESRTLLVLRSDKSATQAIRI